MSRSRLFVALAALLAPALLVIGCSRGDHADPHASEIATREAFAKQALADYDAGRALGVSSTSEIQFEEGFSILSYDPPDDFHNHAFRWMGQYAHIRLKSHGARPMKLVVVGWVNEKVIRSKPVMNLFIDGQFIATTNEITDGHYWIETVVPAWVFRRPWVDLTIRTTAVGFHWGDPPELKVALVYRFGWTEAN